MMISAQGPRRLRTGAGRCSSPVDWLWYSDADPGFARKWGRRRNHGTTDAGKRSLAPTSTSSGSTPRAASICRRDTLLQRRLRLRRQADLVQSFFRPRNWSSRRR
ncbi:hypothetical protein V2I01_31965 [Micromonospora sp. BRA006-A]|nr:hypothetical protein [Micromonospora sp. BRA006-A]